MKRVELYLMVKATEDPEIVIYAVVDAQGNPGVIGEFPKLAGPPVNTVRAIAEFLGDVLGLILQPAPQTPASAPARTNAWLN